MKLLLIQIVFVAVAALGCAHAIAVQTIDVAGDAMLPALKDGDRIMIDRRVEKLERGDIVIYYRSKERSVSYIHRIVGLPGETVEIREGEVFINGNPIKETHVEPQNNQSARSMMAITLPQDSYFVLGDNRDNSADSRVWGPLKKDLIYGKYTGKYERRQVAVVRR